MQWWCRKELSSHLQVNCWKTCNNGYSDISWTFLTLKMISCACFNSFRYFKNISYINFDCLLYKIKFWKFSKPWENSFPPGEAVLRVHYQSSNRCHPWEKQICLILLVLGISFQLCVWHVFLLIPGAHFSFGTIFKEVSHTWVSPKECHFCR